MIEYQASETFRIIADRLAEEYGSPGHDSLPLGNQSDPVDELVYIILTVMTESGAEDTFAHLRALFPRWESVTAETEVILAEVLRPIGLYHQRARRLVSMFDVIREREGSIDLRRLKALPDDEIEAYLSSLPGVGKKVARCVMLYSFRRNVFPVDTHVLRVLKRLGFASGDLRLTASQDALQKQVPEILRFTLHVNLVVHGRTVCRARKPRCADCVLSSRCPSAS
ncbi:MAG: endonuclease III [Dehalococcoidia bacterium]